MSARALRRHHRQRMVKRAREILERGCVSWDVLEDHELDALALRRADNIAWCSCYSCGNPRRHLGFTVYSIRSEKRTRQEILADLTFLDWKNGRDQ